MSHADQPFAASPDILPLGLDGLLVRFARDFSDQANARALALHQALCADPPQGYLESAPALASLQLRFDCVQVDRAALESELRARLAALPEAAPRPARLWHIPAAFGDLNGPQLAETAALAGTTPEALIAEFTATELRVLALGFAPGQPYLGTLPSRWNLPRLDALTPQVPRGAITTAIGQVVLFANPSPTGWRWLGRTAFRLFAPEAETPVALAPGDALRFHAISAPELDALQDTGDPLGGARLERRG